MTPTEFKYGGFHSQHPNNIIRGMPNSIPFIFQYIPSNKDPHMVQLGHLILERRVYIESYTRIL